MESKTDSRQRILDAACELIYARNYADVGVAEICKQADVKKGSFYHFFPSKRDLTLAAMEETYTHLKQTLFDKAFDQTRTPLARLREFIRLYTKSQENFYTETGFVPGCPFGNLAAEQATQDESLRGKVCDVFARITIGLNQTLREAINDGEIPPLDTQRTAEAMLAYLEGVTLIAKTQNNPTLLNQLLPAMLDVRIAETI